MAPTDDELTIGELGRSIARIEKQQKEDRSHVDERFDRLQGDMRSSVAALAFVSKDTYTGDKAAVDRRLDGVDKRIDGMRTLLLSLAGLFLTAIAIVITLMRGFR